jgi:hypothetical protein
MKTAEIKGLQFVQQKGLEVQGFGIIAEAMDSIQTAHVMTADMDENFGVLELSYDKLEVMNEEQVRNTLEEIAQDIPSYVYFIIQLNDIPELSAYHLPENDFIANVRATNEVCLYWKEQDAE